MSPSNPQLRECATRINQVMLLKLDQENRQLPVAEFDQIVDEIARTNNLDRTELVQTWKNMFSEEE